MKEKKFEAVLKRSVAMFNMMTGRDLTEREGNAFIQIFDLVDEFHQPGADDATEAFNVITAVQPKKGLRDRPADDILQKLNIPTFVAAEDSPRQEVETPPVDMPRHSCGCPDGCCTCTDQMLSTVAEKHDVDPQVLAQLAKAECAEPMRWVASVGPDDQTPEKAQEVDAAWQAREIEQAEEFDSIEAARRAKPTADGAVRYVQTGDKNRHPVGYDWQICALCRSGSKPNSIIRCYRSEPTPEEFYDLYIRFERQTHWVFLNRWNNGAGRWDSVNKQYLAEHEQALRNLRGTLPPRVTKVSVGGEPPKLNLLAIAKTGWLKPEFPWRISRKDGHCVYLDHEPTRVELTRNSDMKFLAVKQKRPEIYL